MKANIHHRTSDICTLILLKCRNFNKNLNHNYTIKGNTKAKILDKFSKVRFSLENCLFKFQRINVIFISKVKNQTLIQNENLQNQKIRNENLTLALSKYKLPSSQIKVPILNIDHFQTSLKFHNSTKNKNTKRIVFTNGNKRERPSIAKELIHNNQVC